jgi:hypothetical protein
MAKTAKRSTTQRKDDDVPVGKVRERKKTPPE